MKAIGAITLFIVWMVIQTMWAGYVLSILWTWFVVSLFPAAPALSIAAAAGLSLIIHYLTFHGAAETDTKKTTTERIITGAAQAFCQPLFALIFGWLIHMYI